MHQCNWPYHKYGVPSKEGDFAQDCACAEWILLWHVRQTHSGFHRHYTQTSPKIPDFTKKAQVSWMCFIILNDLYTAHHNLLGTCTCHQLKIRHLYGTFNFSTQCICMGTGSLFVYGFCHFRGKARPLRRKSVFAVASIPLQGDMMRLQAEFYRVEIKLHTCTSFVRKWNHVNYWA